MAKTPRVCTYLSFDRGNLRRSLLLPAASGSDRIETQRLLFTDDLARHLRILRIKPAAAFLIDSTFGLAARNLLRLLLHLFEFIADAALAVGLGCLLFFVAILISLNELVQRAALVVYLHEALHVFLIGPPQFNCKLWKMAENCVLCVKLVCFMIACKIALASDTNTSVA